MNIREGVFERIEDSFNVFKNNFVGLFLPFFLYNFISIVIIGTISKFYMIKSIAGISDMKTIDFFSFLNNSTTVIVIIISMILFILYLLFYVVILLSFIKSVKQAVVNEKIDIINNIMYGFSRFMKSMKTYWYIFAYIALIPAILFIIGGILFNFGFYYSNLEILIQVGAGLMALSGLIFIFFAIYRGLKTIFAIYSAVDNDDFSKENFNDSVKITNNNWWRILGNFMLVSILITLVSGIISSTLGIISFFGGGSDSLFINLINIQGIEGGNIDINDVLNTINLYISNFSIFGEISSNIISNILTTAGNIFIFIFTYIFYLRLKEESNKVNKNIEL